MRREEVSAGGGAEGARMGLSYILMHLSIHSFCLPRVREPTQYCLQNAGELNAEGRVEVRYRSPNPKAVQSAVNETETVLCKEEHHWG
jgi:hypothetical protein